MRIAFLHKVPTARFLLLIALNLGLLGCQSKETELDFLEKIPCQFVLEYPEEISNFVEKSFTINFENISTGEKLHFTTLEELAIPRGLYNITCIAEGHYNLSGTPMDGSMVAKLEEFEVIASRGERLSLRLTFYLLPIVDDFLIEEIFFTGTLHPSGKQYHGDNYVILYNGTDKTLYADGIAFCESRFHSVVRWDYQPDIRHEAFAAQAVYVVPGDGKEHPVAPGERFILCDTGIDHRQNNPNSFDLSKANFEWYDVSTKPAHQDFDSPLVDNLDKWYCYTLSFFVLHNRGFRSYVIARTETDKETFLKDYLYEYTYVLTHDGVSYDMSNKAYKIPNSWIIDGVNCSVQAKFVWTVLPEHIDSGWTHCGTVDKQKDRYFHSIRRKYLGKDAHGNKILQDTNNSTADFNPMVTPSLIEEHETATDAKGTPATTKTYDGVIPRKE